MIDEGLELKLNWIEFKVLVLVKEFWIWTLITLEKMYFANDLTKDYFNNKNWWEQEFKW
jgi:hypothetical protein